MYRIASFCPIAIPFTSSVPVKASVFVRSRNGPRDNLPRYASYSPIRATWLPTLQLNFLDLTVLCASRTKFIESNCRIDCFFKASGSWRAQNPRDTLPSNGYAQYPHFCSIHSASTYPILSCPAKVDIAENEFLKIFVSPSAKFVVKSYSTSIRLMPKKPSQVKKSLIFSQYSRANHTQYA